MITLLVNVNLLRLPFHLTVKYQGYSVCHRLINQGYAQIWEEAALLAACGAYENIPNRIKLVSMNICNRSSLITVFPPQLSFALQHCPVETVTTFLNLYSELEMQIECEFLDAVPAGM